ncbi:MAG: hypothetical protein U5R49_03215 [Deltaproteobacteria bacterium]|nr:hypothetical protein [Deltaproteobacteria bacterium]
MKRKFGKIYIRFGEPVSLTDFVTSHPEEGSSGHKLLAFHLIRSINSVTLATPFALMATAILTRHRRGFHVTELTETTEMILNFFKTYHIPMASTLSAHENAVRESLAELVSGGVINTLENVDGSETFYYLSEDKIPELSYYKHSIIHYFVSHAFVALSLLAGKEEITTTGQIESDYDFLKRTFRYEFIYDERQDDGAKIEAPLAYFMEAAFIVKDENREASGYRLTKLGFDLLPLWADLIKPFLESYWIAARTMLQDERKRKKRSDTLKNMVYMGHRFNKQGVINHIEAVNPLNFKNAVRLINTDILSEGGPSKADAQQGHAVNAQKRAPEMMERLSHFSQRLHTLSQ